MKKTIATVALLLVMLLGLPLAGVWLGGGELGLYLEFPPTTRYVEHAGFSLTHFVLMVIFVVACTAPLLALLVRRALASQGGGGAARTFPVWGWLALAGVAVFWVLAWTRLAWFAPLQPHTYTPLWLCYILLVHALTFRRTGHCLLLDRPRAFLLLFPLSAAFWWFFEYLNRFVQNWHYEIAGDFSRFEYALYATISFSTVLPAVLGTRDLLLGYPAFDPGFRQGVRVVLPAPRILAGACLLITGVGLAGIGVFPDLLYPLLWISPLLIIVATKAIAGQAHVFTPLRTGDWRGFAAAPIAALICGCLWEMWNYYSLAKWTYSVPYVQRFTVFEMPALGFAGYLPFGLECAVVGQFVLGQERGTQ